MLQRSRMKSIRLFGFILVICIATFQLFRDVVTSHSFLSSLSAIVDFTKSKAAVVMPNSRQPVLFDLISVGSFTRPDYQDAQQKTFGSHRSIRHFFRITEEDDSDQECHRNLTNQGAYDISTFCRTKQYAENQFFMGYLRNHFARIRFLKHKANPAGWMCAQKRHVHGFAKSIQQYRDQKESLPDYLVIMDDDTYLNMELVSSFLNSSNRLPLAIAGCMIRSPIRHINFTSPYGGWGMIYNKAALENFMRPITCNKLDDSDDFLQGSCKAVKDNQLGELEVFQEGITLIDLMQAFVSRQPYSNFGNWTNGFCLHSDWMFGYFSNFYPISIHDPDPFYQNVPQARMLGYNGSEIYGGHKHRYKRKQCDYSYDLCTRESHICHYQNPTMMARLSGMSLNLTGLILNH